MSHQKKTLTLLILILVIAAFFRFYKIAGIPPGLYPDEAMNGNNAVEAIRNGEYKLFYPENNGREGLFINIQSLSVRAFGTEPWALRIVSALFGTLTVLGLYLLTKELFWTPADQGARIKNQGKDPGSDLSSPIAGSWELGAKLVAIFASFFLATSFWHINFSRIGFRAIMVPFLLVWSFYFLYRMLRSLQEEPKKSIKSELLAVAGGILFGLGFHTYIAYRVAPLLLFPPLIKGWTDWRTKNVRGWTSDIKCFPCYFVLFLFAAFVAILPIGYYFLNHPEDFVGRAAQLTIFNSPTLIQNLGVNLAKTVGMFFVAGDYNWRHNYAGAPQLWWPVSILSALGILIGAKRMLTATSYQLPATSLIKILASQEFLLLWWLAVMSIPLVISNEGLPHALRAIGMIPPAMILAGLGFAWLVQEGKAAHKRWLAAYPQKQGQLMRIKREVLLAVFLFFVAMAVHTFDQYFIRWANHEDVPGAFSERYTQIGRYLRTLPEETSKYVIVNTNGVEVRGVPMPAQPVMFALGEGVIARGEVSPKHVSYLIPQDIAVFEEDQSPNPTYFVMLETDTELWKRLRAIIPAMQVQPTEWGFLAGRID